MKIVVDDQPVFIGTGGAEWQPGRPVLLLLHGAGMDRTVWVLLARYFARHGWNVVAPDLPAHGASGGAALDTIDAQADWVWQLIDHLRRGVTRVDEPVAQSGDQSGATPVAGLSIGDGALVAAGHSMGALATLAMAGQRPGDIVRLVLLGVGYPMAVGEPLLAAACANDRAAVDMITIYGHAHASRLGRNTVAGISVVNSAAALIGRTAPGVLHVDLAACNAWQGGEMAAQVFGKERSGIIVGSEDRMTPMRATRQLVGLLDAELRVLEDCGHMVMSEQPETVLQALKCELDMATSSSVSA